MKKLFSILSVLFIASFNILNTGNIFAYDLKVGEYEYSCPGVVKSANSDSLCIKIAEVCNGQNYGYDSDISFYEKDKKLVRNLGEYHSFDYYTSGDAGFFKDPFDETQAIYKDNMAKIFECGMNGAKEKTITEIEKNVTTSSPELKLEIQNFILKQKENLQKTSKMCLNKDNLAGAINNKDFLKISTYETCKYQTYLDYLKSDYYGDLRNIAPDYLKGNNILSDKPVEEMSDIEKKGALMIIEEQAMGIEKIDKEIDHTNKVFSKSYRTYLSFESNYNVHLWLEILKIDLKTYNTKLKGVLGPLAQVVPKIINAMTPSG